MFKYVRCHTYIFLNCSENIKLENDVNRRLNKKKEVACKKILGCTHAVPFIELGRYLNQYSN
jgi:hypothetical protein